MDFELFTKWVGKHEQQIILKKIEDPNPSLFKIFFQNSLTPSAG